MAKMWLAACLIIFTAVSANAKSDAKNAKLQQKKADRKLAGALEAVDCKVEMWRTGLNTVINQTSYAMLNGGTFGISEFDYSDRPDYEYTLKVHSISAEGAHTGHQVDLKVVDVSKCTIKAKIVAK